MLCDRLSSGLFIKVKDKFAIPIERVHTRRQFVSRPHLVLILQWNDDVDLLSKYI